jgi:hypothetical protein
MGADDGGQFGGPGDEPVMSTSVPDRTQADGKGAVVAGKEDVGRVYGGGAAMVSSADRDAEAWQETIKNTVKSVVSVRYSQPYSFDTSLCHTSEATGFVIDAENGYAESV